MPNVDRHITPTLMTEIRRICSTGTAREQEDASQALVAVVRFARDRGHLRAQPRVARATLGSERVLFRVYRCQHAAELILAHYPSRRDDFLALWFGDAHSSHGARELLINFQLGPDWRSF